MSKKLITFLSIICLLIASQSTQANAAVRPGNGCKILGSKVVVGNVTYTCIKKSAKKFVWDKGVWIKSPPITTIGKNGNLELGIGNIRIEADGCHEKTSATLQIQTPNGWRDLFPNSGWREDSSCTSPQVFKPFFEGTLVGGSVVRWRTINSLKLEWFGAPQTVSFGTDSDPKLLILATDLPLQGGASEVSSSTNKAVELILKQMASQNLIGKFVVGLRFYDNSTSEKGSWDDAKCANNAQLHVSRQDEIAVIGGYNAGCTKIMVPILNKSTTGPMAVVSHAASNPGLTKPWNIGEPEKYYPVNKRNFFRVATTDDSQGYVSAKFAFDLGVKSVYVLNDGSQP